VGGALGLAVHRGAVLAVGADALLHALHDVLLGELEAIFLLAGKGFRLENNEHGGKAENE
jgi:hypothetical protein